MSLKFSIDSFLPFILHVEAKIAATTTATISLIILSQILTGKPEDDDKEGRQLPLTILEYPSTHLNGDDNLACENEARRRRSHLWRMRMQAWIGNGRRKWKWKQNNALSEQSFSKRRERETKTNQQLLRG